MISNVDKRLTADDLSPDQREVYEAMCGWVDCRVIDGDNLLTIGGYAGTGKSTLLGVFAASTALRVAYCAFTGRAASVLQRKLRAAGVEGVTVTTIHRLIYLPVIDTKTDEILGWKKRESMREDFDLIVIDEASMVSGAMLADLQSYDVPIVAVGDHGQLPPVMDSGDLMKAPHLRLEKIHRQAEGNPIIQLSKVIRETGDLDRRLHDGLQIRFERRSNIEAVMRDAYKDDPPVGVGVLCWTNKMRIRLNAYARKALGFHGVPNMGEMVICLRNTPPIFNGMRGLLTTPGHLDGFFVKAAVAFPDEALPFPIPIEMCAGQFNREKTYANVEELRARGIMVSSVKQAGMLFDFGYAMTCHKSQGSSFAHAIIYVDRRVEPASEDWRRWMYTAVTRASERVTILT